MIEILRDGQSANPGELGEIVVTQLDNRAMPLVRYTTNDVARVSELQSCPCGRVLPLLQSVEGRLPDIVVAPDGSALVVHFFTILFEYLPGIRQFQILQQSKERITAKIVPEQNCWRRRVEEKVRKAVSEATQGSLAVDFDYVSEIPLAQSNKRRFVVSQLFSAPLTVEEQLRQEKISAIPSEP